MNAKSNSIAALGFVPAMVVQYLLQLAKTNKAYRRTLPEKQSLTSVVMFADISGFTNLTETLSKIGPEGAEVIAFAINRYMELLVKGIGRSGGDIFKFAGDAMIVIWPPPSEQTNKQLQNLCKSALQSAIELQNTLNDTNILENIKLSVKIGFGIGEVNIIHVGGVFQRTEYLATGDPLTQAFGSEHCASEGGQTIISQQVYEFVEGFFDFKQVPGKPHYFVQAAKKNYEKVRMKADALMIKNEINPSNFELIKASIYSYIPAALQPYIQIDQERWSSEIRRLTIMFVNLGIDLSDARTVDGLNHIQTVIQTVQKCIYMHEGSLNKLLMDDKGSTLIVVFGLPPMSHQDDQTRAILTAFSLTTQLLKINCKCFIGISTGTVFAGVVGTSGSRREYSVIGDSVNLAARLMQQACTDDQHKIIICQNTAEGAAHKIPSYYYKSVMLKGKKIAVPLFIPNQFDNSKLKELNPLNYFPDLKTHRNNFPVFQKSPYEEGQFTENQMRSNQLFMIGREEQSKKIQILANKFMKGNDKSEKFITIRGTYGAGKTLFIRKILYRIQEKINTNQYNLWKYGEKSTILTQSVGPIEKMRKLCGIRSILQGFFQLYADRLKANNKWNFKSDLELLHRMVERNNQNSEYWDLLAECLNLKHVDLIENFPFKQEIINEKQMEKILRQLKNLLKEFLFNYFEDINKDCDEYEDNIIKLESDSRFSNAIAPVLICLDDMQNYDELSFAMIRIILKYFNRVMIIGILRDQYTEIQKVDKNKKSQDDIVIEGMVGIEGVLDQNYIHSEILRGLSRNDKDDEFQKLIKIYFNIHSFQTEEVFQVEEAPSRRPTVINTDFSASEKKKHEFSNYYLYNELKAQLLAKDPGLLFTHFLYLKSAGNSYIAINFIHRMIQQNYLKISAGKATITLGLIKLIDIDEIVEIDAPVCRMMVNGPLIDHLSCGEQLILKAASVIGDNFDVQTIAKLNPIKNAVDNQYLIKLLTDLESKDILEIMELSDKNKYYRFTHPFLRECLYQRMIFQQRRQLHSQCAETLQIMPQMYESEEVRDSNRLEFHWLQTETRWTLENTDDPQVIVKDKNSFQNPLKMITKFTKSFLPGQTIQQTPQEEQSGSFSHKALKSIILKQIQNKLARSKNDSNTIIKEGFLEKKSDKNISWAQRYVVLDGKSFRYYYTYKDAESRVEPLSTIMLKHIYAILPLNEKEINNKSYAVLVKASAWFKKNKEMNERKFYFAASDNEQLETWTIYMEFAKAKAVYDDFVNAFGKIKFPITSQEDQYDPTIKFEIDTKKKQQFDIQKINENKPKTSKSIMYRQSRMSNFSAITNKSIKVNVNGIEDQNTSIVNNIQDIQILKERVSVFIQKATLLFYSHLFDMSIQRQDEYKAFGQTNNVMRKLNYLFKIERPLLDQQVDISKMSMISSVRSSVSVNSISSDPIAIPGKKKRQGIPDNLSEMINKSSNQQAQQLNKSGLEKIEEEEGFQSNASSDEQNNKNSEKKKEIAPFSFQEQENSQFLLKKSTFALESEDFQYKQNEKPVESNTAPIENKPKLPFMQFKSNNLLKTQKSLSEETPVFRSLENQNIKNVQLEFSQLEKKESLIEEEQQNQQMIMDQSVHSKQSRNSFQSRNSNQSRPSNHSKPSNQTKDSNQSKPQKQSVQSKQSKKYEIYNDLVEDKSYNKQIIYKEQPPQVKGDFELIQAISYSNLLSQNLQTINLNPQEKIEKSQKETEQILKVSQAPIQKLFEKHFNLQPQTQNKYELYEIDEPTDRTNLKAKQSSQVQLKEESSQELSLSEQFSKQQEEQLKYNISLILNQVNTNQEMERRSNENVVQTQVEIKPESKKSFDKYNQINQISDSEISIQQKELIHSHLNASNLSQKSQAQSITPKQFNYNYANSSAINSQIDIKSQIIPQTENKFQLVSNKSKLIKSQKVEEEKISPTKETRQTSHSQRPQRHTKKSIKQDQCIKEQYFGIALKNCHAIRGDNFSLKKGDKVLVTLLEGNIDHINCSVGSNTGLFDINCIKILKGNQIYQNNG